VIEVENLAPQDGDPELCREVIDAGPVREIVDWLHANECPDFAERVRLLDQQNAARGRELERLRALLAVDLKDAVTAESELNQRQVDNLLGQIKQSRQDADELHREYQDQLAQLQEKLVRAKDKANLFYRGWVAAEARQAVSEVRRAIQQAVRT